MKKTSMQMSSISLTALTITVFMCSSGLSLAQKIPSIPPPSVRSTTSPPVTTLAPPVLIPQHFYNVYGNDRPALKKLIDGTRSAIFFLSQQNATAWQENLLPLASFTTVLLQDYRDAIKAAVDIFNVTSSDPLATNVLNGIKSDICAWLSGEIPGFICSESSLHQLSRTLEMYQVVRNARDQVLALDGSDQVTGDTTYGLFHYRCAWINSHVLGSCLNISEPRSQDSKVRMLDQMYSCSFIPGAYNLCSNVV